MIFRLTFDGDGRISHVQVDIRREGKKAEMSATGSTSTHNTNRTWILSNSIMSFFEYDLWATPAIKNLEMPFS